MFSLIISIIAIALVAALALASIYYGGSAFQEGSADAEASTVVNQGQQISAAFTMADVAEYDYADTTDGNDATLLGRLVEGDFLKEVPSVRGDIWVGDDVDGDATIVRVSIENGDICSAIEERFDGTDTYEQSATPAETQAFGCHADASNANHTAYFRL